MRVNVSVYNDADLLDGALASVRDALGDVPIRVVDGKYDTFRPDASPNSTDHTAAVAATYGAAYDAAGPFDRERDKHVYRVESAPADERVLFMDADERLLEADRDALEADHAYSVRIANALVYGPQSVYWPRSFIPETVHSVNRWDAYLFTVPHDQTDAVTLVHRHDLRDREYRREKYDRFEREGRTGRYVKAGEMDEYLTNGWDDVAFDRCPECGEESVTTTQWTAFGPTDRFSRVRICVAGDRCHASIESVAVGEYRYVPDNLATGFEEDPDLLRLELIGAGCPFLGRLRADDIDRMRPSIELWVRDHFDRDEPAVFDISDAPTVP